MMGLKCKVPNTDFVAAAFAEKLLTIGAGDNVVRLLPPLIASDEDISRRRRSARPRLPRARSQARAKVLVMGGAPRHFLDICDLGPDSLRRILDVSRSR